MRDSVGRPSLCDMDKHTQNDQSPEAAAPLSDSQIIDALGGTMAVATLCEVRGPSVSEWRYNGIPRARRQYLALIRPDLFPRKPKLKVKIKPRKAGAA